MLVDLIPGSVLDQLRNDGLQVDHHAGNQVHDVLRRVWEHAGT
jgi:hypothetical protein